MRRNLFIAAMSLLVMAGCTEGSDELDKIQPQGQDNLIKFSTYVGQQTKAVTDKTTLGTNDIIHVFAHYNTNGASSSFVDDFIKADIQKTGNIWGYVSASDYAYWPKNTADKIDFVAIYPSKLKDEITSTASVANGNINIAKYDLNTEDNEVLYATAMKQEKPEENAAIALQFKHALAKIVFKAKKATGITSAITVTDVKFGSPVKSAGTCEISNIYAVTPETIQIEWTAATGSADNNYAITGKNFTLTETAVAIDNDNGKLVIPQSVGSYTVDITYKYKPSSLSAEKSETASFSLTGNWDAGKTYTYTFEIKLDNVNMGVTEDVNGWEPTTGN